MRVVVLDLLAEMVPAYEEDGHFLKLEASNAIAVCSIDLSNCSSRFTIDGIALLFESSSVLI